MMDYNRIHELKIDEVIWVIFIFLNVLNIIGDECECCYCTYQSDLMKNTSKNIFSFTIFISLLIYFYFEYQRYYKFKQCKIKHQDSHLWGIRCFGGFLVIIATILFLYCQIVDSGSVNPQIE